MKIMAKRDFEIVPYHDYSAKWLVHRFSAVPKMAFDLAESDVLCNPYESVPNEYIEQTKIVTVKYRKWRIHVCLGKVWCNFVDGKGLANFELAFSRCYAALNIWRDLKFGTLI